MGLLERPRLTGRSDGLDLLRFLLALYVICGHLSEWGPATRTGDPLLLRAWSSGLNHILYGQTNPAVAMFIVLSGYCIHRNECRGDGWSVRSYAIRRAFRIVPVYLLAVLFAAVIFAVALRVSSPVTVRVSSTSAITMGGLLAKLTGLAAVIPSPHLAISVYQNDAPLRTVAAEMWLYAFYAGAMLLLSRKVIRERALWAVVVIVPAAAMLALPAGQLSRMWWFNDSMIAFLPLWWIGAALVGLPSRLVRRVGAAGLFVLAALTIWLQSHQSFGVQELRLLALGVVGGCAITMIDGARLRVPRLGATLGRSGYSLYAFHAPLLALLIALGVPAYVTLVVVVAFGAVMFRIFESPLTRHGRRLASLRDDGRVLATDRVKARAEREHDPSGVVESPA